MSAQQQLRGADGVPAKFHSVTKDDRGNTYYRWVMPFAHRVCFWFDRQQQLWCVQMVDAEDNQLGGSQHVPRASVPTVVLSFEQMIRDGETPPIK